MARSSAVASTDFDAGGFSVAAFVPADRWRLVRLVCLVAYGVTYVYWFRRNGIVGDRISVLVSVTAVLVLGHLGRPWYQLRQLVLDLALYSAMWLAYEETRGSADRLGFPLQVESVRNIDRALFLGADPTVWLQNRFYSPEVVRWYDVVASVVYFTHFVLPAAVIVVLWLSNRHEWVRLMRRLATLLFGACVSFVVLPTAPPWMAGGGDSSIRLDALAPIARPTVRGWRHLELDIFVHAWETGRDWANKVAAMPSLHAAFALLVVAFFFPWVSSWWWRCALLLYPLTMGIVLVYLGEHYVADVLAGWALVGCSCALWSWIERRSRNRRASAARAALSI
ncbi:MAG: phosphatase PAP2 family protein [Actinomycetota bacterium]|nr:phosphatase PAP2 family protein [Actinomycetota bacterium]